MCKYFTKISSSTIVSRYFHYYFYCSFSFFTEQKVNRLQNAALCHLPDTSVFVISLQMSFSVDVCVQEQERGSSKRPLMIHFRKTKFFEPKFLKQLCLNFLLLVVYSPRKRFFTTSKVNTSRLPYRHRILSYPMRASVINFWGRAVTLSRTMK